MNSAKLYYTPPSNDCFNELQKKAIDLWSTTGSEPSYSQEKIERIRNIKNVDDNFMYIVAMFDIYNQRKLANKLSASSKKEVRDRLIDGGADAVSLIGWC